MSTLATIGFVAGAWFVLLLLYGLSHDVRRLWRDHQNQARFLELQRRWREREELELLWLLPSYEPWDRWRR